MNKKFNIAIIIVAAIVVLFGIFYMIKNKITNIKTKTENTQNENVTTEKTETKEEPSAQKEEYIVTYTDSGFSPEITKIKIGEIVVFKNESASEMWVASAPHPTHTAYPEFDAKQGYQIGESYSFTFTKKGEWKYHNHLSASQRGTIIVE